MSEPLPVVLDLIWTPPDPAPSSRVFQSANVPAAALSLHYSSSRHSRVPSRVGDSVPCLLSLAILATLLWSVPCSWGVSTSGSVCSPLEGPPSASVAACPALGGLENPRSSLPLSGALGPNWPTVAGFVPRRDVSQGDPGRSYARGPPINLSRGIAAPVSRHCPSRSIPPQAVDPPPRCRFPLTNRWPSKPACCLRGRWERVRYGLSWAWVTPLQSGSGSHLNDLRRSLSTA